MNFSRDRLCCLGAVVVSIAMSQVLGPGVAMAQTKKIYREISNGVYQVQVDLAGRPLKIQSNNAIAGEALEISRANARQPAKLLIWNGERFRQVARAGRGDRTLEIPARLVTDRPTGFLLETRSGTSAIIVTGRPRPLRSIVNLFEKGVRVTLVNSSDTQIAYHSSNNQDGDKPGDLRSGESRVFRASPGNPLTDPRQILVGVEVPSDNPITRASFNFYNPPIGYPSANGFVGSEDFGFNYDVGESQSYSSRGFTFIIERLEDSSTKEFRFTVR